MTALHLGPLHPAEQVLTLLLAFGPFVLLAAVVWVRRRADRRAATGSRHEEQATDRRPTPG